jgi:large conductance mechanosensitive channel
MKALAGFMEFIRTQGVIGLAVGFLLGGAVSKLVSALVTDIVNPLVGIFLGVAQNLKEASWQIHGITLLWGDFAATFIDFVIISAIVYFGVKGLGLDKIDKKKE